MEWSGWFNLGGPAGGFNGGPATISRTKDVGGTRHHQEGKG